MPDDDVAEFIESLAAGLGRRRVEYGLGPGLPKTKEEKKKGRRLLAVVKGKRGGEGPTGAPAAVWRGRRGD